MAETQSRFSALWLVVGLLLGTLLGFISQGIVEAHRPAPEPVCAGAAYRAADWVYDRDGQVIGCDVEVQCGGKPGAVQSWALRER